MGWFSAPNPKEIQRQQQKELRSNGRELDRELRNLTLQEQKLEAEIKILAKKNQEQAARILAKQIIDIRQHKQRLMGMKGQISSVSLQSKQTESQNTMAKSLSSTTTLMKTSNQQLNPKQTQAMLMSFEKESMKMEMGSEMVNDTLDSVFDASEAEIDEDALVDQVYDEIGLEFSQSIKAAPTSKTSITQSKVSDEDVNKFLAQFEQE